MKPAAEDADSPARSRAVVESRTETSLLIAFFDLAGDPIASGSASEGEEFAWND